ncbi:MAG TPA: hypothetical protein VMM13_12665 [Euzebya sp.]|nr:hypothetical protein [Euzebya sp.]
MSSVAWVVLLLVAGVGLVLLDRALLAAERRRWIYYRKTKAPKGAAAEQLLHLAAIWDPGAQHILEQRDAEEDAADEDPGPSDE